MTAHNIATESKHESVKEIGRRELFRASCSCGFDSPWSPDQILAVGYGSRHRAAVGA